MTEQKKGFDSNITLAQLITYLISILVIVIGAYINLRMDISTNQVRIQNLENQIQEQQQSLKEYMKEQNQELKEVKTIVQSIQLEVAKSK